jgi:hypothetical protein
MIRCSRCTHEKFCMKNSVQKSCLRDALPERSARKRRKNSFKVCAATLSFDIGIHPFSDNVGFRSRIVNLALRRFQNINPMILFGYRCPYVYTTSIFFRVIPLPVSDLYPRTPLLIFTIFISLMPPYSCCIYLSSFIGHRGCSCFWILARISSIICRVAHEIRRVDICPANIIQYADAQLRVF